MSVVTTLLAVAFGLLVGGAGFFVSRSWMLTAASLCTQRVAAVGIGGSVLTSTVVAWMGPGAPTGVSDADGTYRAVVGALGALTGSVVGYTVLLLVASVTIATILAGEGDAGPLAAAALVPGVIVAARRLPLGVQPAPTDEDEHDEDHAVHDQQLDPEAGGGAEIGATPAPIDAPRPIVRLIGSVAGGLLANALLRLPTSLQVRFPSTVAGVLLAVLVAVAMLRHRGAVRRLALAAGLLVGGVAGLGAVTAISVANDARTSAQGGIDAARRALDAARRGDAPAAAAEFDEAAGLLRAAEQGLATRRVTLGRYLPVIAPNLRAARALTAAGADVASEASAAVGAVDISGLRTADGRIDVEQIAALQGPMADARSAVERALDALDAADGPWTAAPITRQALSLRGQLESARSTSADAAAILDVLPDLLGLHGPRRYLLVVPTPAEARGSGGMVGSYGEIAADRGSITLSRLGRTVELNQNGVPGPQRVVSAPADYIRRYSPFQVSQLWQNVTLSPDFPSSAEAMASLYPQSGGSPVDGVISADPFALAAILRLTGPLTVEGWPEPITADNAPQILLHDWYSQLTEARNAERIDLQGRVAAEAWSRLLRPPLPTPSAVGTTLGEAARGRNLQFWSSRPDEQRFFARLGIHGAVDDLGGGDGFAAITNNAGANKIEWFLTRTIRYEARVDLVTGAVSSTATLDMRNAAPASGEATYLIGNTATPPAPEGTSIQYLSLYSPLVLRSATVDGKTLEVQADTELGRNVYSAWIRIPPGGHSVVTATFEGTLPAVATDGYRLVLGCQALVNPDAADVRIVTAGDGPIELRNLVGTAGTYSAAESLTCGRRYEVRSAPR